MKSLRKLLSFAVSGELATLENENCNLMPKSRREILELVAEHLYFENDDSENAKVYVSDNTPPPEKRGSIWIKTSYPYGIGILGDGEWRMDYGMNDFPVNTPFLFNTEAFPAIPGGVRIFSSTDLEKMGITDTASGEAATQRHRWAIFEPGKITV
jgi:hypothetical protein